MDINKIESQIPSNVKFIIYLLKSYGYDSYIVGGCVRDMILNRTPNDWDITTSATPDIVINIFSANPEIIIIPTGLKHGTVTIKIFDESYEVTTFRTESNYSDNRRPDSVAFVKDIQKDLSRRDFTINAIAYDIDSKKFIDYFGGMKDIEANIIRCVGNPKERFNEDGLRILRALRFAAQLGFNIDENTEKEIHFSKYLLNNISSERIQSELNKILCSRCGGNKILERYVDVLWNIVPELSATYGYNQSNLFHKYDVWEHTLHCMDCLMSHKEESYISNDEFIYEDIITRLAVLFHDIGKPYTFSYDGFGHFYGHADLSAEMAYKRLKLLKYDNDTIDKVVQLVKYHDTQLLTNRKKSIKKLLNLIGKDQLYRLLIVKKCDIFGQNQKYQNERMKVIFDIYKIIEEIIYDKECFMLKDLKINGNDLISELKIKEGKVIGTLLNDLLNMVICNKINNRYEDLINKAYSLYHDNKER